MSAIDMAAYQERQGRLIDAADRYLAGDISHEEYRRITEANQTDYVAAILALVNWQAKCERRDQRARFWRRIWKWVRA